MDGFTVRAVSERNAKASLMSNFVDMWPYAHCYFQSAPFRYVPHRNTNSHALINNDFGIATVGTALEPSRGWHIQLDPLHDETRVSSMRMNCGFLVTHARAKRHQRIRERHHATGMTLRSLPERY